MLNANLSSHVFVCLIIISSGKYLNAVVNKTSNRPPLIGVQPITKGEQFTYIKGAPSGPENWGRISPNWKTCADGKFQSPVNINVKLARPKLADLKRAYVAAPARLINGHNNIGVEWVGDAGGIEVNGSVYKLRQCHWHIPSEHTVDAELHLVHKNDKGLKAVISTFQTIGQPDSFIGNLTKHIKMLGTKEEIDLGIISANNIRHRSKRNFRYIGSFTTPPCEEGVIWTIGEKVRSVSHDQIQLLKGLHTHEIEGNARPVQRLVGRPIWKFDLPDENDQ